MIRLSTLFFAALLSFAAHGFTPQELWQDWPEERFETAVAPCLRHAQLMESLQALESRFPDSLQIETVGESFLGRSIRMVTLGRGERKILLWSQMHGDEPAATRPCSTSPTTFSSIGKSRPLNRSSTASPC